MMYQYADRTRQMARLEDYLQAIKARKALVAGSVVVGLLLAQLLVSSMRTTYTASVTVLVGPSPVGSVDERLQPPNLERERAIVLSDGVAEQVTANDLPLSADEALENVSVAFMMDSDVLTISATDDDPAIAATLADRFASTYVAGREEEATSQLQREIESHDTQIAAFNARMTELSTQAAALQVQRDAAQTAGSTTTASQLAEQIAVLNAESQYVAAAMVEIQRDRALAVNRLDARQPTAAVLRQASVPGAPDGLPRSLFYLLGVLVGAVAGVVAAFVAQRLDRTARSEEDVALALDTRVLGAVPSFGRQAGSVVMLTATRSVPILRAREAFRRVGTALSFIKTTEDAQVFLFTSAHPDEGKSSVVANLAVAINQAGKRVAVVSADLHRSTLEQRFQLPEGPGLSQYLAHQSVDIVAEVPQGFEDLYVFAAGPPSANPVELLGSKRFGDFIEQLREAADIILIDTAPALSTADALAMLTYVDGVVVVVDCRRTDEPELHRVRADIERSGGTILGAIVNKQPVPRKLFGRRDAHAYYELA